MESVINVGTTQVNEWVNDVVPESVEGAILLGRRNVDGQKNELYELPNGDFCYVFENSGEAISRRAFPKLSTYEGPEWEFSESQRQHIMDLLRDINAENADLDYASCKQMTPHNAMGEGFYLAGKPPVVQKRILSDDEFWTCHQAISKVGNERSGHVFEFMFDEWDHLMHASRPMVTVAEAVTVSRAFNGALMGGKRSGIHPAVEIAIDVDSLEQHEIEDGVDKAKLVNKILALSWAEAVSLQYSIWLYFTDELEIRDAFRVVEQNRDVKKGELPEQPVKGG